MKLLTHAFKALAFAAIICPMAPALAEQPRGFYIGASVGESDADIGASEIDDIWREAFASQGVGIVSKTSSIDTKDSTLYIFAGYRILQYLSVEGGYIDLGKITHTYNATVAPRFSPLERVTATMDVDTQGATINAIGHLPLSDYFDIHGRAGFFLLDSEVKASLRRTGQTATESDSTTSFAGQIGLGVGVHLGNHFSLSADWTHYLDVGNGEDEDDDGDDEDYDGYDNGFDVDVLSISAIVRF